MTIDPGKLRHRVTIQQRRHVQDGLGGTGRDELWDDVGTFWAAVMPLRGREYLDGLRVEAELTHKVMIRYQPGISILQDMRAVFGDRVLNIESVANVDERNEWLELRCREVVESTLQ